MLHLIGGGGGEVSGYTEWKIFKRICNELRSPKKDLRGGAYSNKKIYKVLYGTNFAEFWIVIVIVLLGSRIHGCAG